MVGGVAQDQQKTVNSREKTYSRFERVLNEIQELVSAVVTAAKRIRIHGVWRVEAAWMRPFRGRWEKEARW